MIIAHSWGHPWFLFSFHTPHLTHPQILSVRPSSNFYRDSPNCPPIHPAYSFLHSNNSYASENLNTNISINCPKPSNGFLKYMGVQFNPYRGLYGPSYYDPGISIFLTSLLATLHFILNGPFTLDSLALLQYVKQVSAPRHLYLLFFLPEMLFLPKS